jgi:glutathione synthase/RimK-type ligase-like ATP-grasp enzyme
MGAIKYILTAPVSFPSAKLLRDRISALTKQKIIVTKYEDKVPDKRDILFSYGQPSQFAQLNTIEFMHLCSNKQSFSKFANDNGFKSPAFSKSVPAEADFPLIIRTTLHGHGGKGIIICHNREQFDAEWNDAYWWTKFVFTSIELRVHVFDGEVLKIFKKIKQEGLEEDDYAIRNLDNGYHFSVRETKVYPKVIELVKKLHPLFKGATFYGIDLAYDDVNKEYVIWEINTACGLNEETSNLYADRIVNKLRLP